MGKIGYIRVSTEHQETARQEALMKQYQVERVFAEKMSGKNANRPELKAMLEYVRFGRSSKPLPVIWQQILAEVHHGNNMYFKNNSSLAGAGFFYYRYTAFQSCAFRVHYTCFLCTRNVTAQ